MRCLVIAPGDGQGLALDRLPQPLPAAVGLTSSGECLVLSGSAASVVPGMQMPSGESVRALSRLLVGAVAELSEWIEHHRPLIPLGMPEISPLDLPSEFSGDARRLCATASAVLETCGRIDEWTMERDRSAGGMRDPLREVAHLARRALSAAITTRTLAVSGRANR
jgi:hypothetical protein